jgi:ribonuclease HI
LVLPISDPDKLSFQAAACDPTRCGNQTTNLHTELQRLLTTQADPHQAALKHQDSRNRATLQTLDDKPAQTVIDELASRLDTILDTCLEIALETCTTKRSNPNGIHRLRRTNARRRRALKTDYDTTQMLRKEARTHGIDDTPTLLTHLQTSSHTTQNTMRAALKLDPQLSVAESTHKHLRTLTHEIQALDNENKKETHRRAARTQQRMLATHPKRAHKQIFSATAETDAPPLHALRDGHLVTSEPARIKELTERYFCNLQTSPTIKTGMYLPAEAPRNHPWETHGLDNFKLETKATQLNQRPWLHSAINDRNEYWQSVKDLRNGKAPGPDGVLNEILKILPPRIHDTIHALFRLMWATACTPQAWKQSTTHLLYKNKGSELDLQDYRPIGLSPAVYKLYTRVVNKAVSDYAETHSIFSAAQSGFRRMRNTEEQLEIVIMALEDARTYGKDIFALFLDLTSAFNTTHHDSMLMLMYDLGFGTDACDVVRGLYTNALTRVALPHGLTDPIPVERGTIQGDTLSPTLFLIYLECLLRWLHVGARGYKFGCLAQHPDGTHKLTLSNSTFADDVSTVASSVSDLQAQAQKISMFCKVFHLVISMKKTKVAAAPYCMAKRGFKLADAARRLIEGKIHLQGTPATYIGPDDPFDLLGVTLTMTLDWSHSIRSMLAKLRDRAEMLTASHATPAQTLRVVEQCLKTSVAYQMCVTPCRPHELEIMDTVIGGLIKRALRLPKCFPKAVLREHTAAFGVGSTSISTHYHARQARSLLEALNDEGLRGEVTRRLLAHHLAQLKGMDVASCQTLSRSSLRLRQLAALHECNLYVSLNGEEQFASSMTPAFAAIREQTGTKGLGLLRPLFDLPAINSISDLLEPTGTHVITASALKHAHPGLVGARQLSALRRLVRLACDGNSDLKTLNKACPDAGTDLPKSARKVTAPWALPTPKYQPHPQPHPSTPHQALITSYLMSTAGKRAQTPEDKTQNTTPPPDSQHPHLATLESPPPTVTPPHKRQHPDRHRQPTIHRAHAPPHDRPRKPTRGRGTPAPDVQPREALLTHPPTQTPQQHHNTPGPAPAPDAHLPNHDKQNPLAQRSTWHSSLGDPLRDKVTFEMTPINPHTDTAPTGRYSITSRTLDMWTADESNPTQPHELACVMGPDGRLVGTLTWQRLAHLHERYEHARVNGSWAPLKDPVGSFEEEVASLLLRYKATKPTTKSNDTPTKQDWTIPAPLMTVLVQMLGVRMERLASPLDVSDAAQFYWSKHDRDQVFGARTDCYTNHWHGWSIAHPTHTDKDMRKALTWALASADSAHTQNVASATLLVLPDGLHNCYDHYIKRYPRFIQEVARFKFKSGITLLPHGWWHGGPDSKPSAIKGGLKLVLVWNDAARKDLADHAGHIMHGMTGVTYRELFQTYLAHAVGRNSAPQPVDETADTWTQLYDTGIRKIVDTFPENPWAPVQGADDTTAQRTPGDDIRASMHGAVLYTYPKSFGKACATDDPCIRSTFRPRWSHCTTQPLDEAVVRALAPACACASTPCTCAHALRFDWREVAYTDGSCIKLPDGGSIVGAGVALPNHPEKQTYLVRPGGEGPTNTITRAELSAIYAWLTIPTADHGPRALLTDSAAALWLIRRAIHEPMTLRRHAHRPLLEAIVLLLRERTGPVTLGKCKAHSGIVGNELADCAARKATNSNQCDITCEVDPHPFACMYWPCRRPPPGNPPSPDDPPHYLKDLRDDIGAHTLQPCRLGTAQHSTSVYATAWHTLAIGGSALNATSNRFTHDQSISSANRRTVWMMRTGCTWNKKLEKQWYKQGDGLCPLCKSTSDGCRHIAGGCPELMGLYTNRHHALGRIVAKAVSKASRAADMCQADVGNTELMASAGICNTGHNIPRSLLPDALLAAHNTARNSLSRPDITLASHDSITLVELKVCNDTDRSTQLQKAQTQHDTLVKLLKAANPTTQVRLLPIMIGATGTIYTDTKEALALLGLGTSAIEKTLNRLHTCVCQHLHSIVQTRRAREYSGGTAAARR